jgi:Fe-S oxidoreductase
MGGKEVHVSHCCARPPTDTLRDPIGTRINVLRAEQALARQPAAVATGCPYCAVMLGDGLAQKDERIAARDIAELVADALV